MRRAVSLLSAALCLLALAPATPAGANVGLELTGVLSGLPAGGLALPVAAPAPAVMNTVVERGTGFLFPIAFQFTPQTAVRLVGTTIQNGQLVLVKLVFQGGTLVADKILEVPGASLPGVLTGLPGGTLTVPPPSEVTVTLLLCGAPASPLPIVVTPGTEPELGVTLTENEIVEVQSTVFGGRISAVQIDPVAPGTPLC